MKPWNKGRRLPVEVLTVEEIASMLRFCRQGATQLRNRALVIVLWRCGLRVSEALSLYPKDVDSRRGSVSVLHGKGDRSRVVGIDDHAVLAVERWMVERSKLGLGDESPLFCTLRGARMWPTYVRTLLRRLGKKAGVKKRVHPHGLRHTHAYELRKEGIDIGVISKQLGHSNMATTAIYLDHVCPLTVIQTIRGRRIRR